MSFDFIEQPIDSGLYEPEGIYLTVPFLGTAAIIQAWGENPDFHTQYTYNGVPLKGHIGIDFRLEPNTELLAVDDGQIIEIGREVDGFGQYVKVSHRWGESFYAHLRRITVESGQIVKRASPIGLSGQVSPTIFPHLHFGIRIAPYSRSDGWGGFSDPLPYLYPENLQFSNNNLLDELFFGEQKKNLIHTMMPSPMAFEKAGMRRP